MRITGGTLKGRKIKTPSSKTTRPTQEKVRESIFNMLQFDIPGSDFLDLFAGSGAVGIEALSRGAKSVTFVERNRAAGNVLKSNLKALELDAKVFIADVQKVLPKLPSFDIVFLDPPYGVQLTNLSHLVKPEGLLIFETIKPVELAGLSLKKTKTFGDTLIHVYENRNDSAS